MSRRSRHLLLLLLCVASLLISAALPAQSPETRHRVTQWQDSLFAITDTASLRRLRTEAVAAADESRGESIAVMRLALVEFRLAELTADGRLFGEATRALEGVHTDHPTWPVAGSWYAEARLREERLTGAFGYAMRAAMGLDPAKPLVEAFLEGTGPEGRYGAGLIRLASWAGNGRDPVVTEVALRALRKASPNAVAANPEVALWRSRIERLAGDPDSALTAIELAARLHPDHPLILRDQALLRFVYGRGDGAGPWYRGLAEADGAALSVYLHDLDLIVPDSIRRQLATVEPIRRGPLMRRFWNAADPDGLPSGPERLAEHYRRREFAWAHYLRKSVRDSLQRMGRVVWADTLPVTALDARGRIMLLHGTPASRTSIGQSGGPDVERTLGIIGMPRNESWRYDDPRYGTLLYHFYVPTDSQDFVAAESILDILGATRQFAKFRKPSENPLTTDSSRVTVQAYGAELVSEVAQALLRSRMSAAPIYQAMLEGGKRQADSLQAVERTIGHAALLVPSTYELGFELDLHAAIDVLVIGSDAKGPVVQVAFAIPADGLTARPLRNGVVYPIRMRVALLDTGGGIVAQIDTVRGFVTGAALRPGQYLLGQLPVHVAPGVYRARVALEAGRSGTLSPVTTLQVGDPTGGHPILSDISIGQRSVGIVWRASPSDTAWTDPRHSFSKEREMQLYFEAAGLAADSTYAVDLAIGRVREGAASCPVTESQLTIRFSQQAERGINRFQRGVSLRRLDPGEYLLGVTITAADGQQVRRCRMFRVTE